tara:strand:+ start:858 stop:2141 length:1284 start_codon:yes stop_codon:yes gene_type:complete
MKSRNCLIVFNNSWGEVDFMLPILNILNEKKFNIYTSFKSPEILSKKKGYKDLYGILKNITKIIQIKAKDQKSNYFKLFLNLFRNPKYLILKLKNFNLFKIKSKLNNFKLNNTYQNINFIKKNNIRIDFILCADFDSNYFDWIREFPSSKFFLFPHAITLRGTNLNRFRNVSKKIFQESFPNRNYQLSKFPKNTILFGGDKNEIEYFKQFSPKNINLRILGFPRLSKKWIKYLHSYTKFNAKKNKKKNIFLVIGKVNYLGKEEIENKIKSVVQVAEENGYNLIVKNHPRNNLNLKKFFGLSKKVSISESKYSISGTLKFCDVVVLTSKSGVSLECVFQKKIVIEFYKYGRENKKNRVYEFKLKNKLQSVYKYLDLIHSCNSHKDLAAFFKKLNNNKRFYDKIINKQNIALFKILHKQNKIKSIVNFI